MLRRVLPHVVSLLVGLLIGLAVLPGLGARGWSVDWSAFGSLATALAVVVAIIAMREQWIAVREQIRAAQQASESEIAEQRIANKAENAMAVTIDLFGEWRARDSVDARRMLYAELHKYSGKSVHELPEEIAAKFIRISNFCDLLGLLVEKQLVDYGVIAGYLGDAIRRLGKDMMPFIVAERTRRLAAGDSNIYQQCTCRATKVRQVRLPCQTPARRCRLLHRR